MAKTVKELEKELRELKERVERVERERIIMIPYPFPQPVLTPMPVPAWPYRRWWEEPYITWTTKTSGTADLPMTITSTFDTGSVSWASPHIYPDPMDFSTSGYLEIKNYS